MSTPVYWSSKHFASKAQESAFRTITCEGCGAEYVYKLLMRRSGAANRALTAMQRAGEEPDACLRGKINRQIDLVPCPSCGWYQQNMVRKARASRLSRVLSIGLLTLALAALVGLALIIANLARGSQNWGTLLIWILGVIALGISILKICFAMQRRYTPNAESVTTRIECGKSKAMLRQDFEAWQKTEGLQSHTQ